MNDHQTFALVGMALFAAPAIPDNILRLIGTLMVVIAGLAILRGRK